MVAQAKAWSYSAWSLYDTCPLQYKLAKIDKVQTPDKPALKRGREVHLEIANYLKGSGNTLPQIKNPDVRALYDEIRAWPDKLVEQQWGFTNRWTPTGWFGKDTWLRSVLDVAVLYEDMAAEVVDHKTGRMYDSHEDQMELFAVSVMCHTPAVVHVTTRLAYIDVQEQEFGEYPASDRDKLIDKWTRKVEPMFADREFLPRPGDHCRFCDYAKSKGGVCRYG